MRLTNTANDTAPLRRTSVRDEEGNLLGFVEFTEDGKARTTAELGERVADAYENVEITDRETSPPDADADDDVDEADEEE